MEASNWLSLGQTTILLFTLVILIWQTRENVKATRSSQYQSAVRLMFEWRSDVLKSPALAESMKNSKYFEEMFAKYGVETYFHTLKLLHTPGRLH